ncbi:MAG: hypothetical protein A2W91_02940 [Bacteroidetes bacterium GWF2_38_335]|nr:MAG: hypothetical protein A2W91_02940 [Bacteroidetes bacterium GWF2_38_335]OFY77554.1 MAG: hypothetical protein A2281_01820 [Bacteroidetes bacterium RIFOXYA12_FULL_38_20]
MFSSGQDCNIISKANDIIPNGLCAPVSLSWEVTYRGVNNAGTPVEIQFDWDDGNPVEIYAAVNTSVPLAEWRITVTHVYPPGGNRCNYNPSATLMVNGVLCTSTIQEQTVTVWDTDEENGGEIQIDPQVFPICVGNDGWVVFDDVSLFNCVPPVENDNPNTYTRWTQWVYGTDYTIANVEVDGAVQVYAYPGDVEIHPGAVTGPTPPNIQSLPIYVPNTALVGQYFEVTLNYWNYCNPYPDSLPVQTTAIILIVPYPDATINPAGPFCDNASNVTLHAATPGGIWSGPGIINTATGTFSPSAAGPGIHTITYNVTDGNGCTGTDTQVITVWESPTVDILPGNPLEVCPGDDLFLDGNPTPGDGAITSMIWTGNTGPLSATNIQSPTFNTVAQGNYNLIFTVTDSHGCSDHEDLLVSVNPVTANIMPEEVCAGENANINGNPDGGTGIYVTHLWTGDTGPLSATNVQIPVFNTTVTGTYSLTYSVTDDNGCFGSDVAIITVFENPVALAGADDSICGPVYILGATPSLGTGTWTQTSGPGTSSFSDSHSASAQVTVTQYGSYNFTWTEINGPGCTSQDLVTVVFLEQPFSNAGPTDNICGLSYPLTANPSAGTGTWSMESGPGNASFGDIHDPTTNVTVDAFGSYGFQWYEDNGNGCVDSATVVINFDLVPTPGFLPVDTTGCPPFNVPFINTTAGGVTYSWNFGDGESSADENPVHTFYNSTTGDVVYTIQLTAESMFGCTSSISHNLTVHPLPNSSFTNDGIPGCSPVTVNFNNTSTGAVGYEWIFGDGNTSVAEDPTHTFYNTTLLIQYYNVQLVATTNYNCNDTSNAYVTVYPNPDYTITATPDSGCHPAGINFLTLPGASFYHWDYGNGTSESASFNTYAIYTNVSDHDTTFTITLVAESFFGCIDTSQTNVVIHPKPTADFVVDVTTGCTEHTVNITNLSNSATEYFWDFGDGSTGTNADAVFSHTYVSTASSPVTYILNLRAENYAGCADSVSRTIIVYPEVFSGFIVDTAGCSPVSMNFINTTEGAIGYQWDFGDGGSASTINPIHTFYNLSDHDTTYTVTLVATSSYLCTDTFSTEISIHPKPDALFTIEENSGCTPFNLLIENASTGVDEYLWNFGDGATSNQDDPEISHLYINSVSTPNVYNVVLNVENEFGCTDEHQQVINVFPDVVASFICDTVGCHPLIVNFINQSFGSDIYLWSLGGGGTSSLENPTHIFQNETNEDLVYTATLVAQSVYGCQDTYTQEITVYPQPMAEFIPSPITQEFPSSTVTVDNVTAHIGSWEYLWSFDDGITSTISEPGFHNYSTWGDYDIQLIVNGEHCSDTVKHTVSINAPVPVADIDSSASGCPPMIVEFINNSLYGNSFFWDFGDGFYSSEEEPVHVYEHPGTFMVTLTVTGDGGVDIASDVVITVFERPVANFVASPAVVYLPDQPVICYNLSSDATYYLWYFGDGSTSTEVSPAHIYVNEGDYDISLKACSEFNCCDSVTQVRAVTAEASGEISFPNAFAPNQGGPNGGHYNINTNRNEIFFPIAKGVSQYNLTIYTRWGELIFETEDVNVGWDGYYRDKLCKQDVYVWKAKGKFADGKDFLKVGDVTLLR